MEAERVELDLDTVTWRERQAFEEKTGLNWTSIYVAPRPAVACAGLIWLGLQRAGQDVSFDDVLDSTFDDIELRGKTVEGTPPPPPPKSSPPPTPLPGVEGSGRRGRRKPTS